MVYLILLTIGRNDNVNTETVIQISHKFHECNTLVSFLALINTRRLRTFRVFVCAAKICILKGKTVSKLENLKEKKFLLEFLYLTSGAKLLRVYLLIQSLHLLSIHIEF